MGELTFNCYELDQENIIIIEQILMTLLVCVFIKAKHKIQSGV